MYITLPTAMQYALIGQARKCNVNVKIHAIAITQSSQRGCVEISKFAI